MFESSPDLSVNTVAEIVRQPDADLSTAVVRRRPIVYTPSGGTPQTLGEVEVAFTRTVAERAIEQARGTITALVARGHHEELAMHLRAARRNGVTVEEIGETLLQSAIYCGVPDANTAFRIAREVFAGGRDDD